MLSGHVTFVGFGLLASSMAAAIRASRLPLTIRVVSSPNTLSRARELGFADETFAYDDVQEWAKDTDLILLCSPILHILKMLEMLKNVSVDRPVVVSDIGSTKAEICKAGALLPKPFLFVGGHPMAGSEKRTLEYNDPSLFENAFWFLCPQASTKKEDYALLSELISFLGSEQVLFDAKEHDDTIAWLSHMPQMVSTTLAGNLPERLLKNNYQHFAGRGFRDMTRIAASGWNMWHDIFMTNRKSVLNALADFSKGLKVVQEALEKLPLEGDASLHEIFEAGNAGRASLFTPGRLTAHGFYEVNVALEDRPGAILAVMQPLSDAGLNVRDIELMKVRENVSGTLLISFKTKREALQAVDILSLAGQDAVIRE